MEFYTTNIEFPLKQNENYNGCLQVMLRSNDLITHVFIALSLNITVNNNR